jgi:hypothetical protein
MFTRFLLFFFFSFFHLWAEKKTTCLESSEMSGWQPGWFGWRRVCHFILRRVFRWRFGEKLILWICWEFPGNPCECSTCGWLRVGHPPGVAKPRTRDYWNRPKEFLHSCCWLVFLTQPFDKKTFRETTIHHWILFMGTDEPHIKPRKKIHHGPGWQRIIER